MELRVAIGEQEPDPVEDAEAPAPRQACRSHVHVGTTSRIIPGSTGTRPGRAFRAQLADTSRSTLRSRPIVPRVLSGAWHLQVLVRAPRVHPVTSTAHSATTGAASPAPQGSIGEARGMWATRRLRLWARAVRLAPPGSSKSETVVRAARGAQRVSTVPAPLRAKRARPGDTRVPAVWPARRRGAPAARTGECSHSRGSQTAKRARRASTASTATALPQP